MEQLPSVLLVATMDTKYEEALYLEGSLKEAGISVLVLDAGIRGQSPVPVSISREEVAELCNSATGPVAVMVPFGGFSAFDSEDGPLHDPEGPRLFWQALKQNLLSGSSVQLLPHHINDPEFASAVMGSLNTLMGPR